MGTPFTSARSGLWDASDADTWGQGSGVYPQTAGDVVTVAAGHTVTYNQVLTVELGEMVLNGLLTFSRTMSTKLTLGHKDITINAGGELRVGASGAIIPKDYTAELIWNTTAETTKGINLAASSSKLSIYGDPDYFGDILATQLYSDWNGSDLTIYLKGDLSSKWLTGQRLIIHKGRAYNATTCSITTGFAIVSINGAVTYDGTKSTVPVTLINVPNTATSFLANGDVVNISRNVCMYKLAASENINTNTANKPYFRGGSLTTAMIDSCYFLATEINFLSLFNRIAVQNYKNVFGNSEINNSILAHGQSSSFSRPKPTILNTYLLSSFFAYASFPYLYNCRLYGDRLTNGTYCTTDAIFDSCYLYSMIIAVNAVVGKFTNCSIGYDEFGNAKANTTDFNFGLCGSTLVNCKVPASPVLGNRNVTTAPARFKFEHYQQVADAHYIADAFGDITKTPAASPRPGGGTDIIEVIPQPLCAAASYLEILNVRLWAEAGVSKTYRFYVQADFATLPTAEFILYGEYMAVLGSGTLTTVASTQGITTRANAADWSQYVEVTINPAQDGYVNLYVRLMGYESGKKVWVDPVVVVTGGDAVTVTPRWSYGEVELDVDGAQWPQCPVDKALESSGNYGDPAAPIVGTYHEAEVDEVKAGVMFGPGSAREGTFGGSGGAAYLRRR